MSRTFVEALREKYCEDDGENQENFVVDIVFSNRPTPTSGSSSDDVELGYLKNMVLCKSSINKAGIPSNGLRSLCPNVVDLDLSFNSINDWDEVLSIFHHLPALKFVNLSGNPLGGTQVPTPCAGQTFGINDLVLNSTQVTWDQAITLGCHLPKLQELHLCQNGFDDISTSTDRLCESLPALKCLRLNGNNISRWEDVIKLQYLPQLHTLILSDNPLLNISPVTMVTADSHTPSQENEPTSCKESTKPPALEKGASQTEENGLEEIQGESEPDKELPNDVSDSTSTQEECSNQEDGSVQSGIGATAIDSDEITVEKEDGDDDVTMAFQALSVLCVSNTKLSSWNDIEALRTFPKLRSLKIRDIPLGKDLPEDDRRRLFIASLPNVDVLNGSELTPTETDKSERHYVRYFSDKPDPPKRYRELVQKHGELKSLSVVDIGRNFTEFACLSFVYGGRCIHQEKVCVTEPVGILKKISSKLVRKSPMFLKLYYLPKSREDDGSELEELILETLPMSRYDMMDGDEIHIDVSQKPQRRGAALLKQGPVTPR
ncbi:tubulin-specific chaperone cofactor E-like protein [Amphiura filiformis]|uniref:tubulin-specific chaperone cofactor E-like protein n=1 Tax=Amphiura filiformis TaxID=82378 RepID=UPI003B210188